MLSKKEEYQRMYEVEQNLWWYKTLHYRVLQSIKTNFIHKDISILDAGCGCGGMLKYLEAAGYTKISGFDQSNDAVKYAQQRGLNIKKGDVKDFMSDEKYDVIICNDVFCYLTKSEIKETLANFINHLNQGGIFISNNNALNLFWGTHDIAVGSKLRFKASFFNSLLNGLSMQRKEGSYWSFALSPLILAIRLKQRFVHFLWPKTSYLSDIDLPNKTLNSILTSVTKFEMKLLSYQPFGSSYYFVCSK